jgi:hypothetical protein
MPQVPRVTAVMIAFHNEDAALERLTRDLLPSLSSHEGRVDSEVLVIDNSASPLMRLADAVEGISGIAATYRWNEGRNLLYGPSLNLAVKNSDREFLLYVCASHGRMYDPGWVSDMLAPFLADADCHVALAGSLYPSGPPASLGFPDSLPWLHIQGGVFVGRTQVLAAHPYPDGPLAHWGSDVYQSLRLAHAGYGLVDVPTVKSVWRSRAAPGAWKYVHDVP